MANVALVSFAKIEWEEAIATAVEWSSAIHDSDPKKPAFFTGRDQSQSLTGFWAAQFGTRTSLRMAGSARSIWRQRGCTLSAAIGGQHRLADRTGRAVDPTTG